MSDDTIKQHKALQLGGKSPGYGTYDHGPGHHDSKPGFRAGGSVKKSHGSHHAQGGSHHMGHHPGHHPGPHSDHHGLDGTIDSNDHHHSHKSHGHGYGVHHSRTESAVGHDGVPHETEHSRHGGPSKNEFGDSMPTNAGTLADGKW